MDEPYRVGTTPRHLFVRGGELVRELVRGDTLRERIAAGWRADETAARHLAEQALGIMVRLHESTPVELVRSLDPSRVLFAHDGAVGFAEPGEGASASDYRAPEQLRAGAVPASDLYGLGALLVFAMTGRSPGELPQKKLVIEFRPHVRATKAFASWLERMLAPAPEDRFASARVALVALRTGRSRPPLPRRTLALAGVLGAVVLSGGAVVGVTELRERAAARERASVGKRTISGKSIALQRLVPRPFSLRMEVTPVRVIVAHTHVIHDLAYAPDGNTLVSCAGDGTVKAWDVATGNVQRAFAGHTGRVEAVAFTRDGRTMVTAGDSTVRVWDLRTGASQRVIQTGSPRLHAAVLGQDDSTVVSFGDDGVARAWDLASGSPKQTYPHASGRIGAALAVSVDGTLLATAGEDRSIKIWDLASAKLLRTLVGHEETIDALAFSPDGVTLVSSSDDRTVRTWRASTGQPIHVHRAHHDEAWDVKVTRDGGSLLSVGADGMVHRADLASGRTLGTKFVGENLSAITLSPDGSAFAVASTRGNISVFALGGRDLGIEVPRPAKVREEEGLVKAARSEAERLTSEASAALETWSGESLRPVEAKLRAALASDPRHAPAWVGLARVAMADAYVRREEYREDGLRAASGHLDQAEAIGGRTVASLLVRARIASARKDDEGATSMMREAGRLAPQEPAVKVSLAGLAVDRLEYDEAERGVKAAFALPIRKGSVSRAYEVLRTIYLARGDSKAAETTFHRQIELDPSSAWLKGNFADFLVRRGQHDRAIATAKEAIALMDYGMAHVTLAEALAGKGVAALWDEQQLDVAKSALDAAITEDPTNAIALYGRGAYYRLMRSTGRT